MRELLFLAHRIPYPPNKGDKIRSWHFLAHLAERWTVHLGCFIDDPADRGHVGTLRDVCAETHFVELSPKAARLRSLAGFLDGSPLSIPYYRDRGMAAWCRKILARPALEAVFAYSSPMAQFAMPTGNRAVKSVIDFVDVDSDKWRQYAETSGWPRSAVYRREYRKLLAFEREAARKFDASVLVSPAEAALFRSLAPESANKIHHVNNGVKSDFFAPDPSLPDPFDGQPATLVFTGMMNYWPNIDAADWMARTVLPRVRAVRPDATFYIVGAAPTPAVQALGTLPGVTVTGRVEDVRPYVQHATAFVAPLRISRGIQNKVLEGMAMAKAVIATPQAFEGLEAEKESEILLADGAEEFANAIVSLLSQPERANDVGARARRRVVESYAWQRSFERLDGLLERSAANSDRALEPARAQVS